MIAPAAQDASHDPAIRGAAQAVYFPLWGPLNPREFKPLKVGAMASELRMDESTAWRAIQKLIECGYLERGPSEGTIGTYRLVWERHVAA